MKILKSQSINPTIRAFYRFWNGIDRAIRNRLHMRIRYSGVAPLQVDGLPFKMYSHFDDGIVDALYFTDRGQHTDRGQYSELNEIKVFKHLSQHATTILDIGANTGLYSIVSQLQNPQATIYAFEPYITNLNRLRKNLELNGLLDRVQIVDKAVGDEPSEIEFAVPENDQICDVLSADTEFTKQTYKEWINYVNVKVPQITIDDFVAEQGIANIDLIKIDVENYETSVFKGMLKTLDRFSPTILVEIFVEADKVKFYEEVIKPLGYHCYFMFQEGIFRAESLSDNPDCRNFILSKRQTKAQYLSFSDMNELVKQLHGNAAEVVAENQ